MIVKGHHVKREWIGPTITGIYPSKRASATNGAPKRIKDYPDQHRPHRIAVLAAGIGLFGIAMSCLYARGWWLVGCLLASAQFFTPAIGAMIKRNVK